MPTDLQEGSSGMKEDRVRVDWCGGILGRSIILYDGQRRRYSTLATNNSKDAVLPSQVLVI